MPESMPRILCAALGIAGAVSLEISQKQGSKWQQYTYSDFVRDFRRPVLPDTPEWALREGLFNAKLQKVVQLSQVPGMTWMPGITRFFDYQDHEYARLLSYKGRRARAGEPEMRPMSFDPSMMMGARAAPPVSPSAVPQMYAVLTTNSTISSVDDQGKCGSCWADAALTAVEGAMEVTPTLMEQLGRKHLRLSRDSILACTRNPRNCGGSGGCDGATAEMAFQKVRQDGVPFEVSWPSSSFAQTGAASECSPRTYEQGKRIGITGFTTLPRNNPKLPEALILTGAPVAVAVDATSWSLYRAGVYSDTDLGVPGEFTVNHVASLVGYDLRQDPVPYYLIKNSWGLAFGENGFIRLEIKDDEEKHCGWDEETHMGVACDGDPDRAWVCGTCGILFDASYPTGVYLMGEDMSTGTGSLQG